ncbi:MAG TPA: hypothetical protein PLL92_07000 [Alicycliphilus sp.]|nr:hypothetical protein [Alicycliphilus sp.]
MLPQAHKILVYDELNRPFSDVITTTVSHREYAELSTAAISAKPLKGGVFIDAIAALDAAGLEGAAFWI